MASNSLKITDITKDLNMKSKDVLALLEECGVHNKKSGATLDVVEADALMELLTRQNQIENLDDYLEGKATIVSDRPKKVAPPKEEKRAEAPVEAAKPAAEKPTAKKSASPAEKATEKKSTPAAKSTEKPADKQEKKPVAPAEEKPGAPAAATVPGLHLRPVDKPKTLPQAPGLHLRPVDKPKTLPVQPKNSSQGKPGQGQRPSNERTQVGGKPQQHAQPKSVAGTPAGSPAAAARSEGRGISSKSLSTRPATPSQSAQPKKPQEKKQKQAYKTILPITGGGLEGSGETVIAKAPKTRVVDTRTTDVDLRKYDEKNEHLVSTAPDLGGGKQKLRKQDNRNQPRGGKQDKERLLQEKLRRAEEEKARHKQLEITIPEEITVGELSSRLKKTSGEVIKKLMFMGVMANVNQTVDYETAYLVADEFGAKVTKEVVVTIEEKLFEPDEDNEADLIERSPVVCVMGHVDHGKTSLLDAIRHTNVTKGEDGGITQAIGAYRVNCNGKDITFLDTPGHEAFTAMRARGAKATDIAILVVAADDGIMPQTVEAINHAKAAGIDIIVAINKMDKPHANPDNVKQGLTQYELVPEEWGGDTICVPVSALTGMGINTLLESVLMVAELKELKANPNRRAKGLVIESRLDKGRGPVATVLVQTGTLNAGDIVIAGTAVGRVRAMRNERKTLLKTAGPSIPVEIEGLDAVPAAGDVFNAVVDEKMARSLAEQRREEARQESLGAASKASLDDLFARVNDGFKTLNIVIKADVDGSVEAVRASLQKLSNEEVKVSVIHAAVGGISESDVMLASASNAIIVGFNVRPDRNATDSAARQKVEIRTYRVIYDCIEEVEAAMKGMLAPKFKENILGHAEVRQTIHVSKAGTVAGSYVQDGKVTRSAGVRVVRDGIVVAEDTVDSLRRFKDDVHEVASGYECGVSLVKYNDLKVGDILEFFENVQI